MNDAFDEEKLAFINGGAANQPGRGQEKRKAIEEPSSTPSTPDTEQASPSAPAVRRGRKPRSANQPFHAVHHQSDMTSFEGYMPLLVNLTTRLSPATADALRRASLELRLQRRKLHTQQEIVEVAVRSWLESNGFGKAA